MSSGFVSGGTIDNPAERDDAWRDAQRELEEKRRAKEEGTHANDGGKSLYEALEANKGFLPPNFFPCHILSPLPAVSTHIATHCTFDNTHRADHRLTFTFAC